MPATATWDATAIKRLRAKLGYTQVEFADLCGVALTTVERWEALPDSSRHLPPNAMARRLFFLLSVAPKNAIARCRVQG